MPAAATSDALRLRFLVRSALASCALFLATAHISAASSAWSPTFSATTLWHDNVTNAERPTDILPAFQTVAEATASHRHLLGRDDSLLLGAHLRAESWPRYDGLDRTALGTALTWQHKFALGAFAPTLRAELTADLLAAREPDRSGRAATAALVYRQRFADVMRCQLGHEWSRTDTRALAFDRTAQESFAQLGRQIGDAWEFTLIARHRYGTVQSYSSPPRPDLVAKGKQLIFVTTFDRATPDITYYFDARTVSFEFRGVRTLGPGLALTLAAETRRTTHGNQSYLNRIVSTALVRTF